MKKKAKIIIVSWIALSLIACGKETDDGKINAPVSSDLEDAMYEDIVAKFENAGFTNVKTEKLEDLVFGWLTEDGEVEEVSINGETTFSADSRYPSDATIVVSYHTFEEEEEVVSESKEESESSESEQSSEASESKEESSETKDEEIITIENNEEFSALLNTTDTADPIIAEFAEKYAGRIIEFDGNIAYMNNHESYTTRYDFLVCVGDYSETEFTGPNFQIRDANAFDLKLSGNNIPDTIGMGDNLHFVAKIIELDRELLLIDPITTTFR
jgi:hypothetical protein